MQLGRLHIGFDGWPRKMQFWLNDPNDPLYSDYVGEQPFAAVRAGANRIMRVAQMLQLGFISPNEARALLGFS